MDSNFFFILLLNGRGGGYSVIWYNISYVIFTKKIIKKRVLEDNIFGNPRPNMATLPPQNYVVIFKQGECSFVDKTTFAQQIGASGMVVYKNNDEKPFVMSHTSVGADAPTMIPSIMVSKDCGERIQNAINESKQTVFIRSVTRGGISSSKK